MHLPKTNTTPTQLAQRLTAQNLVHTNADINSSWKPVNNWNAVRYLKTHTHTNTNTHTIASPPPTANATTFVTNLLSRFKRKLHDI
jgi:hypothetical protein